MSINKYFCFLIFTGLVFTANAQKSLFLVPAKITPIVCDTGFLSVYSTDGEIDFYLPPAPAAAKKTLDAKPYFSIKYQILQIIDFYSFENSPLGANVEAGLIANDLFFSGFVGKGFASAKGDPDLAGVFDAGVSFGNIINVAELFQIVYGASAGFYTTIQKNNDRSDTYRSPFGVGGIFTKLFLGKGKIRFETDFRLIFGWDLAGKSSVGVSFFPSKRH